LLPDCYKHVGHLPGKFDELGVANDTLVLFSSENGVRT